MYKYENVMAIPQANTRLAYAEAEYVEAVAEVSGPFLEASEVVPNPFKEEVILPRGEGGRLLLEIYGKLRDAMEQRD